MFSIQPTLFSISQPPTLSLSLDGYLKKLKDENPSNILIAIENLEKIAHVDPQSVNRIIIELIEISTNLDHPKVCHRCIESFKTLTPLMDSHQIEAVFEVMIELIGCKEIILEKTLDTFISLIKKSPELLVSTLLQDLDEIVTPTRIRYDDTAYLGKNLLNVIGAILSCEELQHTLTTTHILPKISQHLQCAWHVEMNLSVSKVPLKIGLEEVENALCHLTTIFVDDNLVNFLVNAVLEKGDPDDKNRASIFPITKAALNALIKHPSYQHIKNLIGRFLKEIVSDHPKTYLTYNVIWLLGELAAQTPNAIPMDDIEGLAQTMHKVLETSDKWQLCKHSIKFLVKLWPLLDAHLKVATLSVLQKSLLGTHNISDGYTVQKTAARALGKIAQVRGSAAFVDNILDILLSGLSEIEEDVRHAILEAIANMNLEISPTKIPSIFTRLIQFLSDKDIDIQEAAAKGLEKMVKQHSLHAFTQSQSIVKAVNDTLDTHPKNTEKGADARAALIHLLGALTLLFPPEERQNIIRLIQAYSKDCSKVVRDATTKTLTDLGVPKPPLLPGLQLKV